MKKKVFVQASPIAYITLAIFLALAGLCCWAIIYSVMTIINGTNSLLYWAIIIAGVVAIIFLVREMLPSLPGKITLTQKEIFVRKNLGKKIYQYETHAAYTQIEDVYMIQSTKNSKNEQIEKSYSFLHYVVFKCKNGEEKLFNVTQFTKKQVVEIIDGVISRAEQAGIKIQTKSGKEIYEDFEAKTATRR